MAHVDVTVSDLVFDEPILIDGLPGMGLIGKLVADHLLEEFEMTYYAGVYCEGVPTVAAYRTNDSTVRPPVQVFADPDRDLLVLISDIPVSPADAPEFAACITEFLGEHDVTPIYMSGLSGTVEDDGDEPSRELYGLSTGNGDVLLDEAAIDPPRHAGMVTGATGALLHRADEVDLDSVGLLVESTDELPDIDAARVVIEGGIEPIAGIEIDTDPFADHAIEMSAVAESVLEQIRDGGRAERTATFH